ncbi:MAG TPA: hypothetical protein VLF39_02325 [Candidatus Saccharimonadales bacterium]|nr:hypothetical protein [Candidatus Saccharimonadales bacterium]
MNDNQSSKYRPDPLDSAILALKQRINIINKAIENIVLAEANTPDDIGQATSNYQIDPKVNVGQTTTENQLSEESSARQYLEELYNSTGDKS